MQPGRQEVCGWLSTFEMPTVPGAGQKETSAVAAALIKGWGKTGGLQRLRHEVGVQG